MNQFLLLFLAGLSYILIAECDVSPSKELPTVGLPKGGLPKGGLPKGGLPKGGLPMGKLPAGGLPAGGLPTGGLPTGGLPATGGKMNGNCQAFNQIKEKYVKCFEQQPQKIQEIIKNAAGAIDAMQAVKMYVCAETEMMTQVINGMNKHKFDFTEQDKKFWGCVYPTTGQKPVPGVGPRPQPGVAPESLVPVVGPKPAPGPGPAALPALKDKKELNAE